MRFKELKENEILDIFMIVNNNCRNCGNERIEVCECCLPPKMKKGMEEAGIKGQYLYCPTCQEYSIIHNPEYG